MTLAAAIRDATSSTRLPDDCLLQLKQAITNHCRELLDSLDGLRKRLEAEAQAQLQYAAQARKTKHFADREAEEQLRQQQAQEEQRRMEQRQAAEQHRSIAEYRVLLSAARSKALQGFDRAGLLEKLMNCTYYSKETDLIDVCTVHDASYLETK